MKILHIVAGVWKDSGGIATLVLGFSREQAKAGHEVGLVFLAGDRHVGVEYAERVGVWVRTFKRSFPHFLFFSWGLLFGLEKLVRNTEVVHVHSNWTFPVWWGAWLALRYKKVLVMSPQGCLDPIRLKHSGWKKKAVGWMDLWLLRRASVIHATCEAEKRWIEAFLKCGNKHAPRTSVCTMSERSFEASGAGARSGIPRWSGNARMWECENGGGGTPLQGEANPRRPKIVVIPNGVEAGEVLKVHSVNDHQRIRTVLCMGRLHPLKGLDLLVSAWAEVKKCGNGGMRECGNARMRECANAGMRKCADAEMRECGNARMRECANAGMRKCADAEMRECGSEFAWQLVIAGPDEQGTKEKLKVESEKLKLTTAEITDLASGCDADIVFFGAVHGEEKWALMQRADIFVLPSRSENFGMVVGEALSCGVPVVTTAVGPWGEGSGEMRECVREMRECGNAGMRECVREMRECGNAGMRECVNAGMRECVNAGMRECVREMRECGNAGMREWERGLFVVETSVEGITEGLLRMMALSDVERHEMGLKGCEWVKREFSWETVAQQMVETYDNARILKCENV